MDLKSTFLSTLISSGTPSPEAFLGLPFEQEIDKSAPLFRVLSGGSIHADYPFSFDIATLPCHILLYTREGCGKLILNSHVYSLNASSLLFLDCKERFRLDIAVAPWHYDVLFITGKDLSWYYDQCLEGELPLFYLSPYSETVLHLERILSLRKAPSAAVFTISGLLYNIMIDCISSCMRASVPNQNVSTYLYDIRELFDNAFEENYSLEELAKRFHVSKYWLCRKFTDTFGISPLQYLNRRRIHIASHLLLTTNLKIHEIGSRVGISNTNHFITLFKKYMGVTPSEYGCRNKH